MLCTACPPHRHHHLTHSHHCYRHPQKPAVFLPNDNGTSKLSTCATASAQLPTLSEDRIKNAKDAATVVVAAFDSRDGFDVVFECTGAESASQMSVFVSI